jgi:superoxide dismutase
LADFLKFEDFRARFSSNPIHAIENSSHWKKFQTGYVNRLNQVVSVGEQKAKRQQSGKNIRPRQESCSLLLASLSSCTSTILSTSYSGV